MTASPTRHASEVLSVTPASDRHALVTLSRPPGLPLAPGHVLEVIREPAVGPDGTRSGGRSTAYYALASGPDEAELALLVRHDAGGGGFVAGEQVSLSGPHGAGFTRWSGGPLVLCAIGSALGAIRSAWRAALADGLPAAGLSIFVGVRGGDELALREELAALSEAGATVTLACSRTFPSHAISGIQCVPGRVPAALSGLTLRGCACVAGNPEAEQAIAAALVQAGLPPHAIAFNYSPDHRAEGTGAARPDAATPGAKPDDDAATPGAKPDDGTAR